MQNVTTTFVASASELQSSDLYMTVKTTMFTVPSPNLNGVRCTAEFLDEIVENQDAYVGLPLCADVVNLVKGRYEKLGHCYNSRTGTFSSTMIGSFYKFEKEEMKNGECALVGYARIMKRNKNVCKAIGELFADDALKFSFEISCGSYEELEDGTILIDCAANNFLEGMCVVSFPACPDAVAHALVAEIASIGKEAEEMPNEEKIIDVPAEPIVAEAEETDDQNIVAEEAKPAVEIAAHEEPEQSEAQVASEEVPAEEIVAEDETAEVRVTMEHREMDVVSTYDDETGVVTEVREIREEAVYGIPAEGVAQVTQAEAEQTAEVNAEVEEEPVVKTASELMLERVIAELEAVRKELNELRAGRAEIETVVAEAEETEEPQAAESPAINPFISEISTPSRWSLLESAAKTEGYSLLEKA